MNKKEKEMLLECGKITQEMQITFLMAFKRQYYYFDDIFENKIKQKACLIMGPIGYQMILSQMILKMNKVIKNSGIKKI